jgi:hypothetical protein
MYVHTAHFSFTRFVLAALTALAGANCLADELPVVGVLEYVPVMNDGPNVIARPTYIFTDRKISVPTVFSGFAGTGTTLTVVCCFEVKSTTPTSLNAQLSKYGKDSEFVDRMKSINGYRYIYVAQPTADQGRWTPLMKTFARMAAGPDYGVPFSAAAVSAQFDRAIVSPSFTANGVPMTLQTRFNRKSDRIFYTFTRGVARMELSKSGFAD